MADDTLDAALARARERRHPLLAALHAEGTTAYRLFHGIAEGRPGLVVDRYGPLLLAQTFRAPLIPAEWDAIAATLGCDDCPHRVYNHRGPGEVEWHTPEPAALAIHLARELALAYRIRARHRGQDPWLFVDLRAARRWVKANAAGRSVLNVFAYTRGIAVAALAGGAARVLDVDVSRRHLAIGARNLTANGLDPARSAALAVDAIAALRLLAGLPIKGWAARRPPPAIAPERFDLVVLDPPTWATGPYGAVDIVRDYPTLFKPALLATRPGGTMLVTNHAAAVDADAWLATLERSASKVARPLRGTQWLAPDADVPSLDGRPPLKMLVLEV